MTFDNNATKMSPNFHFRGSLEETYLSDMLAVILRHNVPGMLKISREDVVKRVYIKDGCVVHAVSTDRGDRLGLHLYRSGQLTRQQLAETMEERDISDGRFGEILIERGLLSPRQVYEAVRAQMEAIVWSVFSWQKGQVVFQIGENQGAGKILLHLPMSQVVLRGLKKVADTKSLVGRLGRRSTVFRPTWSIQDIVGLALENDEFTLLQLLDGQRNFFDVCNSGPFGMSENARLIYAFGLLGLIEKTEDEASASASGVKIRLGVDGAEKQAS